MFAVRGYLKPQFPGLAPASALASRGHLPGVVPQRLQWGKRLNHETDRLLVWKEQRHSLFIMHRAIVLPAFPRDFGTATPASAPLERGLPSSVAAAAASAAAATSLGEQEYRSPRVDGATFPAPPSATRSTLHDPFMVRSPGLQQQQQQQQQQEQKPPGPAEGRQVLFCQPPLNAGARTTSFFVRCVSTPNIVTSTTFCVVFDQGAPAPFRSPPCTCVTPSTTPSLFRLAQQQQQQQLPRQLARQLSPENCLFYPVESTSAQPLRTLSIPVLNFLHYHPSSHHPTAPPPDVTIRKQQPQQQPSVTATRAFPTPWRCSPWTRSCTGR